MMRHLCKLPAATAAFLLSILLSGMGTPLSAAEAERGNYSWVFRAFGIETVEIGQYRNETARALPELYFREPREGEEEKPYVIGVLLNPEHVHDLEARTQWALSLWFDKGTGKLFRLRASFPPLTAAYDKGAIDSVLRRLGPPTASEIEDNRDPNWEVAKVTWRTDDPQSPHWIRLHLARHKTSGETVLVEIHELDISYYTARSDAEQ